MNKRTESIQESRLRKNEIIKLLPNSGASERNQEIARMALDGMPYAELARDFSISRDRARQIAMKTISSAKAPPDASSIRDGTALIERCDLSVRAKNCLKNEMIFTVSDLLSFLELKGAHNLQRVPNFGKKSLDEIYDFLGRSGIDIMPFKKDKRSRPTPEYLSRCALAVVEHLEISERSKREIESAINLNNR